LDAGIVDAVVDVEATDAVEDSPGSAAPWSVAEGLHAAAAHATATLAATSLDLIVAP
jgi:hypothetical protein